MYVVDIALGTSAQALAVVGAVTRPVTAVAAPVARFALRPPFVPARAQPGRWVEAAALRGATVRRAAARGLTAQIDAALPVIASTLDGHADLTEIVQGHVDLVSVATDLVTEMDLPEIIRGTTGAAASETVLAVRMHSMSADDALGRVVGRLRRKRTPPPRPTPEES